MTDDTKRRKWPKGDITIALREKWAPEWSNPEIPYSIGESILIGHLAATRKALAELQDCHALECEARKKAEHERDEILDLEQCCRGVDPACAIGCKVDRDGLAVIRERNELRAKLGAAEQHEQGSQPSLARSSQLVGLGKPPQQPEAKRREWPDGKGMAHSEVVEYVPDAGRIKGFISSWDRERAAARKALAEAEQHIVDLEQLLGNEQRFHADYVEQMKICWNNLTAELTALRECADLIRGDDRGEFDLLFLADVISDLKISALDWPRIARMLRRQHAALARLDAVSYHGKPSAEGADTLATKKESGMRIDERNELARQVLVPLTGMKRSQAQDILSLAQSMLGYPMLAPIRAGSDEDSDDPIVVL